MADSHPIKYYLPDEIFLLLASLVYALIQRVMEVNSEYSHLSHALRLLCEEMLCLDMSGLDVYGDVTIY